MEEQEKFEKEENEIKSYQKQIDDLRYMLCERTRMNNEAEEELKSLRGL